MTKRKESEEGIQETVQVDGSNGTAESTANEDELKRARGRTITRWKQQVFAELPDGDDQATAARLNQVAHEEGYDYHCTPATVAR